jgi:hypothetical protein
MMKKSTILILTSVILMGWISNVYASEILGYPIVPKQAKFYSIILGVIASSVAMVALTYLCFWLADLKKKVKTARPIVNNAFARELVVAAESAK